MGHRYPVKAILLEPHGGAACSGFVDSSFAKLLISNGVFSQILQTRDWVSDAHARTLKTIEELEINILERFDSILAENSIEINEFEQIYVCCDIYNEFSIYLSLRNISHVMFELFPKQFELIENAYRALKEIDSAYHDLHRKYGALEGRNEYVTRRLLASATMTEDYLRTLEMEKDEWINYDHLWQTLPTEFRQKILQSLGDNTYCLSAEQSCLIIKNSSWNLMYTTGLTDIYTNLLYQTIADYCSPECDMFVKHHPHDGTKYPLKNFIEKAIEIGRLPPLEFYTLVEDFSIRRTCAIKATAIRKIESHITESIHFGFSFYSHFHFLHKAFCILSLAQKYATPSTTFFASGLDMEFLGNFVKYVFPEFTIKDLKDRTKDTNAEEDAFIIVGCISAQNKDEVVNILENATENTTVVLLNVTNVKNQWSIMPPNFVPITITKKATKEEGFLDCLDSELFYFYSPDQTIRETAQTFTLEKTLKHTKLHLSARALPQVSATQQTSVASFIDSWGYHTERDNPILKQLQLRGKYEKDYPVNLTENEDPSSLKIQLLSELLAKQDLAQKVNALDKQIETLKCENNNISLKIEELIAENKRLSEENAEIFAKNTTLIAENAEIIAKNTTLTTVNAEIIAKTAALIAENANLKRDIESLRLPRWFGHFLSNLHPKKKNRQRFREKYVKHKKN